MRTWRKHGPGQAATYVRDLGAAMYRDKVGCQELKGTEDESKDSNPNRLDWRDRAFVSEPPGFVLHDATVSDIHTSGPDVFDVPRIAPWRQRCPVPGRVLRESERAQRASTRDLELYTSILKHDLSNDLQIILTQSEMASMLFPPDSPELECCRTSMGAAERMANLLRFLGTGEFKTRTPLTEALARTITQGRITYPKMKISLRAEKEAQSLVVTGGRLLDALFANMLRNASQHAGDKPEVAITIEETDGFAEITFADNGPGVASEIRDRLFQKGASTEGRGQGLYLCKRITEAYGGKISLDDTNAETGASFRIKLPLANGP